VLSSQIRSDRSGPVHLAITLGADYHVFFNGRKIGREPSQKIAAYFVPSRSPFQPHNLDVATYPVQLRKGVNAVTIIFFTRPIVGPWTLRFRGSVLDTKGRTMAFKDLDIQWD
jgi:hypothetical protein